MRRLLSRSLDWPLCRLALRVDGCTDDAVMTLTAVEDGMPLRELAAYIGRLLWQSRHGAAWHHRRRRMEAFTAHWRAEFARLS